MTLPICRVLQQVEKTGSSSDSFMQGMKTLVREEGIRGALLRGMIPKIMVTAPLGMVSSLVYETVLYMSRKDG